MRRAHSMPFGAEIGPEGVRFALWAPTAKTVALVLDGSEHPLEDQGEGWRRVTVPGLGPAPATATGSTATSWCPIPPRASSRRTCRACPR